MRKQLHIFRALGIFMIALLALILPTPASAQDDGDTYQLPYPDGSFKITQGCHRDGWGNYVEGIASTCAVDLQAGCGTEIQAVVSGQLFTFTDDGLGLGNTTAIIKGTRYWAFYLHGSYLDLNQVSRSQILGTEQSYGNSTGCHTHLSIFDTYTGTWVNPLGGEVTLSSAEVETVPNLPEEIASQLNFTVVVTSIEVEITSTAEAVQKTATPTPEIVPVAVVSPVSLPVAEPTLDINYVLSWVFLVTAVVSIAMIGIGNKSAKIGGVLILLSLGIVSYSLMPAYQFRLEKSYQSTQTIAPILSTPTFIPPDLERQVEEVVFTDVILTSLPGSENIASISTQYSLPQGECRIDPDWPQPIQQWCPWITKYAELNDLEPDWVAAVMIVESVGDSNAMSAVSATGLIQVMPSDGYIGTNDEAGRTAYISKYTGRNGYYFANRPTIEELLNPEYNLAYGTAYLGQLLQKHGSMWEALLYYGGPAYGDEYRGKVQTHYDRIHSTP